MSDRIGIVVSGGPAPGINSVISSVVLAAHHYGCKTFGLNEGFLGIQNEGISAISELTVSDVSRAYKTGGSILGTSRYNPFSEEASKKKFEATLKEAGIKKLIVIGGEGSAYLSYQISHEYKNIQVVHVPKTIDNDLMLPNEYPCFGFETARSAGTKILDTLSVDAKTTKRWFIVTSMGRHAGFLALGLGLASRATNTLIPEEFEGKNPSVKDVAKIVFNTVKKRVEMKKPFGVVVIAEGVLDVIDPTSDPQLASCPRDQLGRIRYSEIHISDLIVSYVKRMCKEEGVNSIFYTKNLGYELRCADPTSFDIEYTTFLGVGAVRHLNAGMSGVMVTRDHDKIGYVNLTDMLLANGKIKSRKVDINSDVYHVARSFMIR